MKVSCGEKRGRGERRDPNSIVEPDNTRDYLMCAYIFSKVPEPKGLGVFQCMERAVSFSKCETQRFVQGAQKLAA